MEILAFMGHQDAGDQRVLGLHSRVMQKHPSFVRQNRQLWETSMTEY